MAKKNRAELKNIFSKGKIPSEGDFHDLIDSMPNFLDEGFSGIENGGLKVRKGQSNTILEVNDPTGQDWYLRTYDEKEGVGFDIGENNVGSENSEHPNSRIFIQKEKGIGIDNPKPVYNLDVRGSIGIESRVGTFASGSFPADGKWRNILPEEGSMARKGIYALEVVASTESSLESSFHSILHAICVGAFPGASRGLKKLFGIDNTMGIRKVVSFYSRRRHSLQIRWAGSRINSRLEIRTRRGAWGKDKDVTIHYQITSLLPEPD